jgi:FkbM family methyltransferase
VLTTRITKLLKILQTPYYLKALVKHRAAAGVEHSRILNFLNSRNLHTVVDIGANRGQFALITRKVFPAARVYAFEPLNEPATTFRQVFATDPQVILRELAVGPNDEDTFIHVSQADDSSSLLPIGSMQSQLFPGTAEKEKRKTIVKRLDSVLCREDIESPALLKIDVQGFEKDVLEGCRELLPSFSYVYVECSFLELYIGQALAHEIISFLSEFGFLLSGIYNLYYDKTGLAIQGDFLFEKKNLSA